jgi:acetyl-CoA carboxylase carboxyl transferase subunit beta
MAWFKKEKKTIPKKVKVPEGLWVKCDICKEIVYRKELERNLKVCPKCNYHFRIPARERILLLIDEGDFKEIGAGIQSKDPLSFKDLITYKERLQESRKRSSIEEAAIAGTASVGGFPVVIIVLDFAFMGGSMGSVVGEKFSLAAEKALEEHLPFIAVISSGGARMQEGILSLMQMAKTSAAVAKKNVSCSSKVQGRLHALYFDPCRPHIWRGYGKLCNSRGYHSCRAQESHRLCRAAGDRTDHKTAAA